MKRSVLLTGCMLALSFVVQAQNGTENKMNCCNSRKEKTVTPVVVMQTQGNKLTALVKNNSSSQQRLHFYLFDLEGTMVHQSTLDNKEKNTVAELKKGTYIYTVFANDESIDEGKIEIK